MGLHFVERHQLWASYAHWLYLLSFSVVGCNDHVEVTFLGIHADGGMPFCSIPVKEVYIYSSVSNIHESWSYIRHIGGINDCSFDMLTDRLLIVFIYDTLIVSYALRHPVQYLLYKFYIWYVRCWFAMITNWAYHGKYLSLIIIYRLYLVLEE